MKSVTRPIAVIGILLMTVTPGGPAFGKEAPPARTDQAELEALRQELAATRAALEEMQRRYDATIRELQQRVTAVEETPTATGAVALPASGQAPPSRGGNEEKEIQLGEIPEKQGPVRSLPEIAGTTITGFVVGSFNVNSHLRFPGSTPTFKREVEAPANPENSSFRFNTFNIGLTKRFADWLIGSAAIEVENERKFEGEFDAGGGLTVDQGTEVNIDTFEITAVAPVGNGLRFSLGKFNVPFGIEREDPPANLQATNSLVFELGRPSKVLGLRAAYQFNPTLDVQVFGVNGWDVDEDNNDGKTVGGRLGFTPVEGFNVGVGGFYGPEQDDRNGVKRSVIDVDAVYTRIPKLTLAAEFVYGAEDAVPVFTAPPSAVAPLEEADRDALIAQKDAEWLGVALTAHYDVSDLWGLTFRYGLLDDRDGGRTGFDQTLQSFTLAPTIHLSSLIPGLETVGTVPRTRHLIANVDLRLEYRLDHSDRDVFMRAQDRFDDTNHRFAVQVIGNF
ncbi:MAG: outer membrane beta-barrel protein [Candidatus Methylomirabilales bacterium]